MRILSLLTLLLLLAEGIFAQGPADSLVNKLQDHDLGLLNNQLVKLVSPEFRLRIEPSKERWSEALLHISEKAIKKSESLSTSGQVIVLSNIAEVMVREGNVVAGYSLASQALKKTPGQPGLVQTYAFTKYSEILNRLNLLDSSLIYTEKIMDIAREIRNDSVEILALDRLAKQCYIVRNFSKSEFYLKKLTAHPLTSERDRMNFYNTIAMTFRKRKMYDSADHWFKKALPIAETLRDTAWLGLIHGNMGFGHYLAKKDDETALPDLLMDVQYSFRTQSYVSALYALSTVVTIYLNNNDLIKSKIFFDSLVHNQTKGGNDTDLMQEILNVSANYYERSGDLKKALQYARESSRFRDSIQTIQNIEKSADLEAQFDFNRQLRKIESLEQQSAASHAKNRWKNYLLVATSIFILLGIGFIYVLQRSNRFKLQTNRILQEQNIMISHQASNLNELNATKDKLLSIISHDLRGPVNSLKALMSMAVKKIISPEEFGHFLGQLQKNVETVNFTLDNVLYWSRSQLRGIQTRPVSTGISGLVDETFNLFSEPVVAKGITVSNTIHPDINVFADPDQIRLVLRNLISNAIKFTDNGGEISITSLPRKDQEIISIKDTGVGMSAEAASTLFTSNEGISTAGTGGEKGTGLGLILCREMIERNQGKIWLESKEGVGTTFYFSLIRTS